MRRLILGVTCFCSIFTTASYAGNGTGRVTQLMPHNGDVVVFKTEVYTSSPSSCNTTGTWILSLNTQTGKAMYAVLLAAATQKQAVYVYGQNTCNLTGGTGREDAVFVEVNY